MRDWDTERVEAFSDGVFAIAITLLILEIKVPHVSPGASSREFYSELLTHWPSFLAFGGSFLAILIMWVNHHGLFKMVRVVDSRFMFANGFLLLLITFVPYPTAVLAEYLDHSSANAAAAFYCGTFVLISIGYNLLLHAAASKRRLIVEDIPQAHVDKIRKAYRAGFPIYLVAVLLALWNAFIGLFICLSLWILWATLDYDPEGRTKTS